MDESRSIKAPLPAPIRYWVIAPFDVRDPAWPQIWDHSFKYDLITIGWENLGDLSGASADERRARVEAAYPNYPKASVTWLANTFRNFYSVIKPEDVILARKGRKELVGVGKVTGPARYDPSFATGIGISGFTHRNLLPVEWQKGFQPRTFTEMVFGIQTIYEVSQQQFEEWLQPSPIMMNVTFPGGAGTPEQGQEFVFERHLEDFMAKNFDAIFDRKLKLYRDPAQNEPGQQYETGEVGRIDLLAQSLDEKEFVVIELKKGRPSDEVVGQTLRYMGWVKRNLCKNDQSVRGIIISPKKGDARPDPQLEYALEMMDAIEHKLYTIQFSLE
jgi:hypothetical protein